MAKTESKKQKILKKTNSSIPTTASPAATVNKVEKSLKKKKKKLTAHKLKAKPNLKFNSKSEANSPSSSSSDSEPEPEEIQKILELFSKEQLIDLVIDAANSSSTLYSKIREIADKDISHRKIFVHGLSWDTTNETLISEFQKFGEIENGNVVLDRATGKSKGYGFVTFKTRKSASNALKEPRMEINNRIVVWQLASLGPASNLGQPQDGSVIGSGIGNLSGRKIYVSNVPSDVSADKLRVFFSKFGELESGPMGFDVQTGKFKGYALFVYKSVDGAKKALEEPYKVFDGRQLHCQKAAEGKKSSGGAAGITTTVQPVPPVYAALAGQNMDFSGQNPGVNLNSGLLSVNPLYSSLLANPNAAAVGLTNMSSLGSLGQGGNMSSLGSLGQGGNMSSLGSWGQGGLGMGMGMGMATGLGGYGGLLGHALSNLGSRGATTMAGAYGGSVGVPTPQGLQYAYPKAEVGQKSPSAPAYSYSGAGARSSY